MLASLRSAAVFGIDAYIVHVEVDVSFGLPGFTMVGLPDASVRESRDRVRTAIRNSGLEFPSHRIIVNLAPADIRKAGASFDLSIALGILAANGTLKNRHIGDIVLLGELSLDGGIQPARGVLPIAIAARRERLTGLLLPTANLREAAVVADLRVLPVDSLARAVEALNCPDGPGDYAVSVDAAAPADDLACEGDLAEVRGQLLARRAIEIAAAGGHNLLLTGPPGSGKTMMARRLPGILPPQTFDEALESTAIHSVAGLLAPGAGLLTRRPFRAPHHTISEPALVGGGSIPRPGEISLAHNGVLFLDEMPEFERRTLEVLRQPLEEGCVRIARAARTAVFPSRFILVGAMNPCPCGHLGNPARECRCTPLQVQRYRSRLSGPLLDRLDLVVEVPALPVTFLSSAAAGGETSAVVRERVVAARAQQAARVNASQPSLNAAMNGRQVRQCCRLDAEGERLLHAAVRRLGLSARGYDRVLKVARTIADLAASDRVEAAHLAEALQYRMVE